MLHVSDLLHVYFFSLALASRVVAGWEPGLGWATGDRDRGGRFEMGRWVAGALCLDAVGG